MNEFDEWVNGNRNRNIETVIHYELFKKYFNFQRTSDMFKDVYTTNDQKKNSNLVIVINSLAPNVVVNDHRKIKHRYIMIDLVLKDGL